MKMKIQLILNWLFIIRFPMPWVKGRWSNPATATLGSAKEVIKLLGNLVVYIAQEEKVSSSFVSTCLVKNRVLIRYIFLDARYKVQLHVLCQTLINIQVQRFVVKFRHSNMTFLTTPFEQRRGIFYPALPPTIPFFSSSFNLFTSFCLSSYAS